MRPAIATLLAATVLVLTAGMASADEPVLIDMEVIGGQGMTVGDRVQYVLTFEADRGVRFTLVPASLPREVVLVGLPQTRTRSLGQGRVETTLTFYIAPFVPGTVVVPPLSVRYHGADIEGGVINTPASRFAVASVLPAGGDLAPRDLKPQAQIGVATPAWVGPAIAAGLLCLVLVAGLMYWRIRELKRRAAYVPAPVVVADSPEDRARGVLDRAGADFAADGDYVAYYATIAAAARGYLSERYGFPAFALTTSELEQEMRRRRLDRWQVRVAGGLLEQCDAVVYARYRPAPERADADLTAAYEIVEMSRPQAQRVEAGVPA